MTTPIDFGFTGHGSGKPILKKLADQMIHVFLPVAVRNNSFIINEIPEKISVVSDESTLTAVIRGLLCAVVNNARDTSIRISARFIHNNTAEVYVKDHNSYHTYAIACGLQEVVPLAAKMGGDINIINQREKLTTVSFTFPVKTYLTV